VQQHIDRNLRIAITERERDIDSIQEFLSCLLSLEKAALALLCCLMLFLFALSHRLFDAGVSFFLEGTIYYQTLLLAAAVDVVHYPSVSFLLYNTSFYGWLVGVPLSLSLSVFLQHSRSSSAISLRESFRILSFRFSFLSFLTPNLCLLPTFPFPYNKLLTYTTHQQVIVELDEEYYQYFLMNIGRILHHIYVVKY
jgi:hypothetical protein